jgi:salicylate hydroxylase
MRAIVVGSGIGGLATALSLRGQGIDVRVVEKATKLSEIGAGLQISANGMRVLREIAIAEQVCDVGVAAQSVRYHDLVSGELLWQTPLGAPAAQRYGEPFIQIHRADLLNLLAGAFGTDDLLLGIAVTDITQDSSGALVTLADGRTLSADVVIGADGIHSRVREWMLGALEPRFSGTLGWRTILPKSRADQLGIDHSCDVWLAPGHSVVTYWMRRGELFNVIGFVPAEEVRRESWTELGDADEMRAAFAASTPVVARMTQMAEATFITGVYFHDPAPRWADGRVALLGDAAHATQPYLAQGAVQSLEDAAVVAHLLARHGPRHVGAALVEYERRRKPRATKVQAVAGAAGSFWHEADPVRIRARNGRFRGLTRLDPLGENTWGWLYHHDPVASIKHPAEESLGLATAHEATHYRRPESRRAVALWRQAFTPADHAAGWMGLRRAYERFLGEVAPIPAEAVVEEVEGRGRWVGRIADDAPVVLHVHGGGFMFGSAASSTEFAHRIGRAVGGAVFVPDYRLAPEEPFPAAADDVVAAYRWLLRQHISPHRIVLSGESAGGGLVVSAAVRLVAAGAPLPAGIYAVSPFADLAVTGASVDTNAGQDPVLGRDLLAEMSAAYLQGHDPADPDASPVYADLAGCPPLLLHASGCESLTDDTGRLAAAARRGGVDVAVRYFDDTVHAFPLLGFLPESAEALAELADFVARCLARER